MKKIQFFDIFLFLGVCVNGWTKYKNKCLKYFHREVKFETAKQECELNNATMISIHSAEENEFVRNFVKTQSLSCSYPSG
jgi:hypothetical protein